MARFHNTPKNWIRLCVTVQEFKQRYGKFPTFAILGRMAAADIQEPLTRKEWEALTRRLPIEIDAADDWHIEVIGENGMMLSYSSVRLNGYSESEAWLGNPFEGCYAIL